MNNINTIQELAKDEQFIRSIVEMDDPVDVQKAFKDRGVDISIDEINQIAQIAFNDSEELSEESLDNVAGGFADAISAIAGAIKFIADIFTERNKNNKGKTIW